MKKGPLQFLQALNKQLQTIQKEIRREQSTRDAPHILSGRTAPDKSRATDETRTAWHWDHWENIGANRHGDGFRRFARGLPAITSDWGNGQPSENFDESEDAPPNGDTEQSLEDDVEVTTRPGPWELEQEGIKLCVARLRQYAALKEPIPSPDFYLAVAQVTLYLYTMNAWSGDDPEPVELLCCFLQQSLEAPDQLLPADSIKTLGEIARTLVAPRTDFSAGTEASLAARALFTTIERAPGALDATLLDEMLQFDEGQHLLTASGTPLTSMSVFEAVHAREARGGFNDAVRVAESLGLEPTVNSPRTLTVIGRFTDHVRLACQLLEGHKGPVAVRLVGSSRRFTILWRDPDLFVITHQERPRWEHFRSPRGLTGLALTEQPRRVPHGPLLRPIVEAEQLAQDLGMNLT